ncbi:MAG: hypothetical protein VXW70_05310, partial [Candidatus Thermoplasmatota archaeon]|nr:hypothetical protein [Candidatus Thermoplasmatota archaeon]
FLIVSESESDNEYVSLIAIFADLKLRLMVVTTVPVTSLSGQVYNTFAEVKKSYTNQKKILT